ncbi:MAG: hypothetical protein IPM79_28670 [Polyangiaceae bacterium]|jgi:hypothetical protein|nr:hypothetical protein [Polyangiaceae bacterium]
MNRLGLALLVVMLAAGCKNRGGGSGGGGAGGSGEGGLGTGGAPEVPASTEPLTDAATQGLTALRDLGAPLVAGQDQVDAEGQGAGDTRIRELVEEAVAGNSIVTDGTCVAFAWSGLSVTVTMTDCTLEASGLPVDGALTLAVGFTPTTFTLAFSSLTLGDTAVDGEVAMTVTDDSRPTDADLTFTTASGASHLVLSDLSIEVNVDSASLSGSGTIDSGALSGSLELDAVTWVLGDACPSLGSMTVDEDGVAPPTTLTFTAYTPIDGTVEVQIGAWPSSTMTLPFCAP